MRTRFPLTVNGSIKLNTSQTNPLRDTRPAWLQKASHKLNVDNAFLHEDLNEEVHVIPSPKSLFYIISSL